jgi:TRAP-type C4-dicarboxylate transport system permease small subunit
VDRALRWVADRGLTVAGLCYLLITALICFDIVARRLLGFSTEATTELTGYLMAVGMSFGLAGTLYERGHVRIDVLVQRTPLAARAWLHLAALLALLAATGFFVYGAVSLALDSLDLGATDLSTLRTPLALPQGVWAAGFALLLLAVIGLAAQTLARIARGRPDEVDRALAARSDAEEAAETLQATGQATTAGRDARTP